MNKIAYLTILTWLVISAHSAFGMTVTKSYAAILSIGNVFLKPTGINVKYRSEYFKDFGDKNTLGMIASASYIVAQPHRHLNITCGPTWRLNHFVSLYGLLGGGLAYLEDRLERVYLILPHIAYGTGVQFHPMPYIILDISYEQSIIKNQIVSLFTGGFGVIFY